MQIDWHLLRLTHLRLLRLIHSHSLRLTHLRLRMRIDSS